MLENLDRRHPRHLIFLKVFLIIIAILFGIVELLVFIYYEFDYP